MTRNDHLNNTNNNNNYTYIRKAVNRISNEIDRKIITDYNSFLQMTSVLINPFSHNLLSRNPVEKL